ncbi:MAG: response regulator transcription factor [Candidatus Obscuribacterales bacterium]|nr:response regulator transcription factor [Cyanobacteria bacterium HKST-UBA01]MCB9471760.1 response regulator transcription factor [Candidatus Obscuribacterales bacterium]
MARILVVEDDPKVSQVVEEALAAFNHIVEAVDDGLDGLERLTYYHYDLAIIDWNLPGLTGIEICQKYRTSGGQIPILFLTGQSDVPNKVEAFDSGADDYLTKPFAFSELMARVKALLRRPPQMVEKILEAGGLRMDLATCSVTNGGQPVNLAPSEFALLELFMKSPGRLFSSDELLNRVFKTESEATDEAVRQRVLRLRKKIAQDGKDSLIKTVKGLGYKFEVE